MELSLSVVAYIKGVYLTLTMEGGGTTEEAFSLGVEGAFLTMKSRAYDNAMHFELHSLYLQDLQRPDGSDKCVITSNVHEQPAAGRAGSSDKTAASSQGERWLRLGPRRVRRALCRGCSPEGKRSGDGRR